MNAWFSQSRLINVFMTLLKIKGNLPKMSYNDETKKALRKVPRKAVETAESLLLEVVGAYSRVRFKKLNLPHDLLKEASNKVRKHAETLKDYANPRIRFKKEDYPLLHSYLRIKKMLTGKESSENRLKIYDNFLLLVPFLILSFNFWMEELEVLGYTYITESKEGYNLARALEFFFASLDEPLGEEDFKVKTGKTLTLKREVLNKYLDRIFRVKEGKIAFSSSMAEILRVKKSLYKSQYVYSLKRALHEVLSGAISYRRKATKRTENAEENFEEEAAKPEKEEAEIEYEAEKEPLKDYFRKYYRQVEFQLDKGFLDENSPEDRVIIRILNDVKFTAKVDNKDDYEGYSFLEDRIVPSRTFTFEGPDAFYRYLSSLIYWRQSEITENDIFLTRGQVRRIYPLLISAINKMRPEVLKGEDPLEKVVYVLMTLTALSLSTGIDPSIFISKLKTPLNYPLILYGEEGDREYLGITEVVFDDNEGVLRVSFSRRGSSVPLSPEEEFHPAENYWIAPIPAALLSHLETAIQLLDEPLIPIGERKLRIAEIGLGAYWKELSEAFKLPYRISPVLLRKTVVRHLIQEGAHPLMANLITGHLPLILHAPFFYLNMDRESVWRLLNRWQEFLSGRDNSREFPEKYKGRFGSRMYPRDQAVIKNLRAWFSILKWCDDKRRWDLKIKAFKIFALYSLLLLSGMRIGEALKLRWQDIIEIPLKNTGISVAYVKGKDNVFYAEERLVPLSPLVARIFAHLRVFLKRRARIERNPRLLSPWIFGNEKGEKYSYEGLKREIQKLREYFQERKIAGKSMETQRFHIYRHYFFSKALELFPESFELIEAIMGHRGGSSFYLWKCSTRSMGEFLEESSHLLVNFEAKVLGPGFRKEIMDYMGGEK